MLGRYLCTLSKEWHWQPDAKQETTAAEEAKWQEWQWQPGAKQETTAAEEAERKWYQKAGEASSGSAAGSVDVKKESSEEDGVAEDYRVLRFMVLYSFGS